MVHYTSHSYNDYRWQQGNSKYRFPCVCWWVFSCPLDCHPCPLSREIILFIEIQIARDTLICTLMWQQWNMIKTLRDNSNYVQSQNGKMRIFQCILAQCWPMFTDVKHIVSKVFLVYVVKVNSYYFVLECRVLNISSIVGICLHGNA